ncbi:MAG: AIR synthase related protein [Dehalococcoidia bacterium]|nr:AIR synthase related protein [Dehalococcoidia bacterium]
MKAGKLPADLLDRLLARLPADPRVLLGPGIGRDAAAIDLGRGRVLVVKADPVTLATEEIGRYVVHVNANDVACLGTRPAWFMATVLLPEGAPPELAEQIFGQICAACDELGIVPVGGHTEITIGLERPMIAGTMLGEADRDDLVRPEDARSGDHLVLTKGIAIEGTALLAREAPNELRRRGVPDSVIEASARLLIEPGISVVREALAACGTGAVHALHDPTEGGLTTALFELGQAARLRALIRPADVPVLAATAAVCNALALDPFGLLASGALLIAVGPDRCADVQNELRIEGVPASCVGELASGEGVAIIDSRGEEPLPRFERDELARFLEAQGKRSATPDTDEPRGQAPEQTEG